MNKDFEKTISAIFSALGEKEDRELDTLVSKALEYAKDSNIDISNPEHFDLFVGQQIYRTLDLTARKLHEKPTTKNRYKADFVYTQYDFLSSHIETLCDLKEGSTCRADKSRFIIEMFLNYSINGTIPDFNPDAENYWIPKFGDYKMWMNYCDSLYELYRGRPENYIKSYKQLLDSEKRTYKHLSRLWYAKFKNGEIVNIGNTWDDNLELPIEKIDEKNIYILHKRRAPKGYDLQQHKSEEDDDCFFSKNYLQVPFDIVEDIYYETEEVYV